VIFGALPCDTCQVTVAAEIDSSSARLIDATTIEAERRLVWTRLFVTVTGTALLPFVADPHGVMRWVAYALLAAGWIQTILSLVDERVLRYFARQPTTFVTAADSALTLLWVWSTGGVDSPWFVALYASIIWVSLHRRPRDTIVAAAFCAAGYLLMAAGRDELAGHVAEVAVRVEYMGVVAVGSAIIARERLGRLGSRLALLDLTQQVGQIGTWEWSISEHTITWSDELHRIFGVPRGFRPTFEQYLAAVHPEDRAEVQHVVEQALAARGSFRVDHRIIAGDGEVRSLHCRGQVVLGSDGQAREMVGSAQDVTEHKKMEAQLLLAGKLASLGTLASGVAHEINNPLAYVASNLELIDRQLDELGANADPRVRAEQVRRLREAVTAARHGSARMRDIVQGLKTFSRTDAEGVRVVDLAHVADLAIEIASHEITRRARLVREYSDLPLVPANESRLSQVLVNLLVNAAQAIEPGAVDDNEIRVRIYRGENDSACVDVSDTGSGIAPEHLERIFDPFFTTKATGEGTGLGLSICHGIVRDLGGEIRVAATGREGTTFRLSLPLRDSARQERAPSDPAPKAGGVRTTRKSVCIIDDEARYAESLRLLLGRDHDVTLEPCAERALELLSSGTPFDVVLCDLMMPGKTGMDLYEALTMRSSPLRERMVFITGGATSERAREFLARPEIRYVEKPVEVAELRALIDEVASAAPAPAQHQP
jgi:signal transduction histidine kinase/CheY-like chemotaxis protein